MRFAQPAACGFPKSCVPMWVGHRCSESWGIAEPGPERGAHPPEGRSVWRSAICSVHATNVRHAGQGDYQECPPCAYGYEAPEDPHAACRYALRQPSIPTPTARGDLRTGPLLHRAAGVASAEPGVGDDQHNDRHQERGGEHRPCRDRPGVLEREPAQQIAIVGDCPRHLP